MAVCQKCGNKVSIKASFCPTCGAAVGSERRDKRVQEYEGTIHKCPNCGEIVNSFEAKCPACGFEFRSARASSAVTELAMKIEKIEKKRKPFSQKVSIFGYKNTSSVTDDQLESLIKSFAIPNTKEDLYEFMILALSNIDTSLYGTGTGMMPQERVDKLKVTKAWLSKFEQAYEKAKISLDNVELDRIEQIYLTKQREINAAKKKNKRVLSGSLWGLVACAIVPFLILGILVFGSERKLNRTVREIQVDIQNGNYDDALLKANTLYYDRSWSDTKADDWDKQREAIIKIIEEKKGEKE